LVAACRTIGLLKVRLYRPFSVPHFLQALPRTVRKIVVLDRTKEAGAAGDPRYIEVVNAIQEGAKLGLAEQPASQPIVLGGRYGLSSKEFTPAMIRAVYDNLASRARKDHFTIGIQDDLVTTPFKVSVDSGDTRPSPRITRVPVTTLLGVNLSGD
jgi:pyruvate-ferredoxin/flavodoxin oxidoreductase